MNDKLSSLLDQIPFLLSKPDWKRASTNPVKRFSRPCSSWAIVDWVLEPCRSLLLLSEMVSEAQLLWYTSVIWSNIRCLSIMGLHLVTELVELRACPYDSSISFCLASMFSLSLWTCWTKLLSFLILLLPGWRSSLCSNWIWVLNYQHPAGFWWVQRSSSCEVEEVSASCRMKMVSSSESLPVKLCRIGPI